MNIRLYVSCSLNTSDSKNFRSKSRTYCTSSILKVTQKASCLSVNRLHIELKNVQFKSLNITNNFNIISRKEFIHYVSPESMSLLLETYNKIQDFYLFYIHDLTFFWSWLERHRQTTFCCMCHNTLPPRWKSTGLK